MLAEPEPEQSSGRSGDDDRPTLPLVEHRPQRVLAAQEGSRQIGLQQGLPVLQRKAIDPVVSLFGSRLDPGDGDQHVQAAPGLSERPDRLEHLVLCAYVRR